MELKKIAKEFPDIYDYQLNENNSVDNNYMNQKKIFLDCL